MSDFPALVALIQRPGTITNGATSGVSVSVQAFHRERANVSFDVISPRWDHSSIGTEVESGYPDCA